MLNVICYYGKSVWKAAWQSLEKLNIKLPYMIQQPHSYVYTQEKEKPIYKNLCTNAHSSIIHNGQKVETTQMSISDTATQWI